ncbi:MAG: hypothetical protein AB7L90_13015 [Hyphomicrobiaceae bacterium]
MTLRSSLLAAGLLALGATSAEAQSMGLAGIHDHVRVGTKVCMKDHFHDGSSNGMASRKAAEAEATRVWQDFTAWEYGRNWGSFRMAESKGVKCSGADKDRSWSCQVSARPCRRR